MVAKDDKGNFQTVRRQDLGEGQNMLQAVFKNGESVGEISFDETKGIG